MDLSSYSVQSFTRRRPLSSPSNCSSPARTAESSSHHTTEQHQRQRLRRTLGLTDVIFYGVGCSVGAGIYSLVGIGAELAGPSIALSFLVCGVACAFTSLAYAEFAARVPLAGMRDFAKLFDVHNLRSLLTLQIVLCTQPAQ